MDLSAACAAFSVRGLGAAVGAKDLCLRIVAYVAGLNDQHILAVGCMGAVPVRGDDAADDTVIERKGAEVFGDQDDRIALAFIGAEGTRRHDLAGFETERFAPVQQPWHEQVVAHHHIMHLKAADGLDHCCCEVRHVDSHPGCRQTDRWFEWGVL